MQYNDNWAILQHSTTISNTNTTSTQLNDHDFSCYFIYHYGIQRKSASLVFYVDYNPVIPLSMSTNQHNDVEDMLQWHQHIFLFLQHIFSFLQQSFSVCLSRKISCMFRCKNENLPQHATYLALCIRATLIHLQHILRLCARYVSILRTPATHASLCTKYILRIQIISRYTQHISTHRKLQHGKIQCELKWMV